MADDPAALSLADELDQQARFASRYEDGPTASRYRAAAGLIRSLQAENDYLRAELQEDFKRIDAGEQYRLDLEAAEDRNKLLRERLAATEAVAKGALEAIADVLNHREAHWRDWGRIVHTSALDRAQQVLNRLNEASPEPGVRTMCLLEGCNGDCGLPHPGANRLNEPSDG